MRDVGRRDGRLPKVLFAACIAVFGVSTVCMLQKIEPFHTWYYSFAWWPYILGAQAWLRLRGGKAVLFSDPRRFTVLAFLSVSFWLVFEMFNFRLNNWHYLNLPASAAVRQAGYFFAFATVVPGLFTTRDLLEYCGLFRNVRVRPLRDARRLYVWFFLLGGVMFAAPLIWPRYCFPLVWGWVVFLSEPVVHRAGGRSFLADWERGDPGDFLRMLAAGGVCGGLWEMWNWLAGAKWVYTVPFVGKMKIFEMPVAGFLGFPPFAVECSVMVSVFFLFWKKVSLSGRLRSAIIGVLMVLAALGVDLAVFAGIDHFTVRSLVAAGG